MFNLSHSALRNPYKNMKIRISTLRLTIAVFGVLNVVDGSEDPIRTAERDGQARGVSEEDRNVERDPGRAYEIIFYGMKPIQVWLDETRTIVQKADFPNCRIPQGPYFSHYSFLIRYANLEGLKLVAYVNQQGDLMAVKPPSVAGRNSLKPTATQWYINYYAIKFRLFVNPERKKVYRIELLSGNVIDHEQDSFRPITVAGIKFNLFRNTSGYISGAELIQDYYYIVG